LVFVIYLQLAKLYFKTSFYSNANYIPALSNAYTVNVYLSSTSRSSDRDVDMIPVVGSITNGSVNPLEAIEYLSRHHRRNYFLLWVYSSPLYMHICNLPRRRVAKEGNGGNWPHQLGK